ncbi:MAG TPA: methyltransferase domain-containing protein [Candidatus Binatia bacterium]|nr:methyltransferase domain-containing protein [Candidatus Binatia bacterium]
MRDALIRVLEALHLRALARRTAFAARNSDLLRKITAADDRMLSRYLRTNEVRKLHIGCLDNPLPGWLNAGLELRFPQILRLDATRPFRIGTGDFDFVFSEHMIEHISHADGLRMLAECHRILRPGGRIRISTPDLAFLIDLHGEDKTSRQHEYVRWVTAEFLDGDSASDTFVINNFFRDWGHQFIYDEKTLRASLQRAGFVHVTRCPLNVSSEPGLCGLENAGRMPEGLLELETLTLEAVKPAASRQRQS